MSSSTLFSCCYFKQKTAYEMRMSDWSSDVCSSDLLDTGARPEVNVRIAVAIMCAQIADETEMLRPLGIAAQKRTFVMPGNAFRKKRPADGDIIVVAIGIDEFRSEEHKSELQSLMRISYAVFCLKKKHSTKSQRYTPLQTKHITY